MDVASERLEVMWEQLEGEEDIIFPFFFVQVRPYPDYPWCIVQSKRRNAFDLLMLRSRMPSICVWYLHQTHFGVLTRILYSLPATTARKWPLNLEWTCSLIFKLRPLFVQGKKLKKSKVSKDGQSYPILLFCFFYQFSAHFTRKPEEDLSQLRRLLVTNGARTTILKR